MEIKFKTVESRLGTMRENSRCTGRIMHNAVLGPDNMAAEIAQQYGLDEPRAAYMAKVMASYIVHSLGEGKKLDFGPFSLSLVLKGSITGVNGAFTDGKNSIGVNFTPGRELKDALAALHPVNVARDSAPRITSIIGERTKKDGEIALGENVYVAGANLQTATDAADEGVWICDRSGSRILAGRVLRSTATTLDCAFDAVPDFSPGRYKFELATRNAVSSASPAICSRFVDIVP